MKIKKLLGLAFAAFLFMGGISEAQRAARVFTGGSTAPTLAQSGDIWIDDSGVISISSFGLFRRIGSHTRGSTVASVATADAGAIAAAASTAAVTATPADDGVLATINLTVDTQPSPGSAAANVFTVDTNPVGAQVSEGTLTIAEQPREGEARVILTLTTIAADTETVTIGPRVYTFQDTLTEADGNILVGANVAASRANLVCAINRSTEGGCVVGTNYATAMTVHPSVRAQTFIGALSIIQAVTPGTAGNAIVSTETLVGASNSFAAATLLGGAAAADTMTLGATVYTFQNTLTEADCNIQIGGTEAIAKTNMINAVGATAGVPGTDYASACTANASVTAAAFAGDAAVITAITAGTAGDSIVSTETFSDDANIFDAATLGTTTAGLAGHTFTIGSHVYTFFADAASISANDCDVLVGAAVTDTQNNIEFAIAASGGTPNVEFSTSCVTNTDVTIANFAANTAAVTSVLLGSGGDSIATTETMTGGANAFDQVDLGSSTAGVNADTYTLDTVVYTLRTTIDESSCNVLIGANNAATQVNIENAVGASAGTPGTDYSSACVIHPTVTMAAFSTDVAAVTAILTGTGPNSISTTETFLTGSNVFSGATLAGGTEAAYSTIIRVLLDEIRTNYNAMVTLVNELRTDYGTAVTHINENKAQINALLVVLRDIEAIN